MASTLSPEFNPNVMKRFHYWLIDQEEAAGATHSSCIYGTLAHTLGPFASAGTTLLDSIIHTASAAVILGGLFIPASLAYAFAEEDSCLKRFGEYCNFSQGMKHLAWAVIHAVAAPFVFLSTLFFRHLSYPTDKEYDFRSTIAKSDFNWPDVWTDELQEEVSKWTTDQSIFRVADASTDKIKSALRQVKQEILIKNILPFLRKWHLKDLSLNDFCVPDAAKINNALLESALNAQDPETMGNRFMRLNLLASQQEVADAAVHKGLVLKL